MGTSQALAERDVADEQDKPADTENEHDQVEHRILLCTNACAGVLRREGDRCIGNRDGRTVAAIRLS
jgi:hypothetical protein